MNTLSTNIRREYKSPEIEYVMLDNKISLALESDAPVGPGEPGYVGYASPEHFSNNPYQTLKA